MGVTTCLLISIMRGSRSAASAKIVHDVYLIKTRNSLRNSDIYARELTKPFPKLQSSYKWSSNWCMTKVVLVHACCLRRARKQQKSGQEQRFMGIYGFLISCKIEKDPTNR